MLEQRVQFGCNCTLSVARCNKVVTMNKGLSAYYFVVSIEMLENQKSAFTVTIEVRDEIFTLKLMGKPNRDGQL